MEFLQDLNQFEKIGLFAITAILGMGYSYFKRWSWETEGIRLGTYLFGDTHAIGRAVTTLAGLCIVTGMLGYLDSLEADKIIVAAFGLGMMVPEKVDKEKAQNG